MGDVSVNLGKKGGFWRDGKKVNDEFQNALVFKIWSMREQGFEKKAGFGKEKKIVWGGWVETDFGKVSPAQG